MKKALLFFVFFIFVEGTGHARDVLVSWVDNSDNENGFLVERTLSHDCFDGWEVIGYTGTNQNSFVDTYTPGACYRVAAYNETGLSMYSNTTQMP